MAKQKSERPGPKPTSGILAYIGGYLDGEGCFMYRNSPIVSVSNTFPYTLETLAELYGGQVIELPRRGEDRTVHLWRIYGDDAIRLIEDVLEYLWEKQPQADLILRIRVTPPGQKRNGMLAQLKKLKKLDYEGGIK